MEIEKVVTLITAGVVNANGTCYTREAIEQALTFVNRPLYGELGQPSRQRQGGAGMITVDEFKNRYGQVREENVCCEITGLHMSGIALKGVVRPSGPHAKSFERLASDLDSGKVRFGIRALCKPGEMKDGVMEVRDMRFVTFDLIAPN